MESIDAIRPLSVRAFASAVLAFVSSSAWCLVTFTDPVFYKAVDMVRPALFTDTPTGLACAYFVAASGLVGALAGVLSLADREPQRRLALVGLIGSLITLAMILVVLVVAWRHG